MPNLRQVVFYGSNSFSRGDIIAFLYHTNVKHIKVKGENMQAVITSDIDRKDSKLEIVIWNAVPSLEPTFKPYQP